MKNTIANQPHGGVDHSWAPNVRRCLDKRYFEIRNDKTKTGEDLDRAYESWAIISELCTGEPIRVRVIVASLLSGH